MEQGVRQLLRKIFIIPNHTEQVKVIVELYSCWGINPIFQLFK